MLAGRPRMRARWLARARRRGLRCESSIEQPLLAARAGCCPCLAAAIKPPSPALPLPCQVGADSVLEDRCAPPLSLLLTLPQSHASACAQVGADSVLEDRVSIKRSVVGTGCHLGAGTKVRGWPVPLLPTLRPAAAAAAAGARLLRGCCIRPAGRGRPAAHRQSAHPQRPRSATPLPPFGRSRTACCWTTCAQAPTSTCATAWLAPAACWATAAAW